MVLGIKLYGYQRKKLEDRILTKGKQPFRLKFYPLLLKFLKRLFSKVLLISYLLLLTYYLLPLKARSNSGSVVRSSSAASAAASKSFGKGVQGGKPFSKGFPPLFFISASFLRGTLLFALSPTFCRYKRACNNFQYNDNKTRPLTSFHKRRYPRL